MALRRIWSSCTCLFDSFYDVISKLGLNRSRGLTFLEFESGFLEFFYHFAPCESSEVSSFFAGRAKGNLLGYSAKFFAFVESGFGVLGFC